MRIQRHLMASFAIAFAALAQAQDPPATEEGPAGTVPLPKALGDVVAGPFDVEQGSQDNRILGVEHAWGGYWVTGRGNTAVGDNYMIHAFDENGQYLASYPQVTLSTGWAGRDMESDESTNTLWVGSDFGEVSEYRYDPVTQGLVHHTLHNTAVTGTVRALCRNPDNGNFFTKSFTSDTFRFRLPTGTVTAQFQDISVSAYGFGWDPIRGLIWATSTGTSLVALSPVDGQSTSLGFATVLGGSQGGLDVYYDARNPDSLTAVAMHQTTPDSVVAYDIQTPYTCNGPTAYCTSQTSSAGCTPSISGDATSCPGLVSSYPVQVTGMNSNAMGFIFYGTNPATVPLFGGTVCIRQPLRRSALISTGGNPGQVDCSGSLSLEVGHLGAPGQTLYFQGWSTDATAVGNSNLSDALAVSFY